MSDINAEAFCEHGVSHRKQCRKCNERLLRGSLPKITLDRPKPDIDAIVAEVERLEDGLHIDLWKPERLARLRYLAPLLAAEVKRLRHTINTKIPALETAMVMQGDEIARLRAENERHTNLSREFLESVVELWKSIEGIDLTRIAELEAQRGEKA